MAVFPAAASSWWCRCLEIDSWQEEEEEQYNFQQAAILAAKFLQRCQTFHAATKAFGAARRPQTLWCFYKKKRLVDHAAAAAARRLFKNYTLNYDHGVNQSVTICNQSSSSRWRMMAHFLCNVLVQKTRPAPLLLLLEKYFFSSILWMESSSESSIHFERTKQCKISSGFAAAAPPQKSASYTILQFTGRRCHRQVGF
jgi:hypothetical protein